MLELLSVKSYLLLSCLRQRTHDDRLRVSIDEYVTLNSHVIEATCRVAEWLGLAKLDRYSVLGWAPTVMLVELLLLRKRQWDKSIRRQGPAALKGDAFQTIFETALGGRAEELSDCREQIKLFLGYLGLMELADDGAWFPTRRLRDLAAKCQQRDEQRGNSGVFKCDRGGAVEVSLSLFDRIEAIVNSRMA
jgi:hypothetical protein